MRPAHVAVGIVDVHDASMQGMLSDQTAGGLNLGSFGMHPFYRRPTCRMNT